MNEKDKQIQTLEKEITRLKLGLNLFERQMKQMLSRQIRMDERARRTQMELEQIKTMIKRRND